MRATAGGSENMTAFVLAGGGSLGALQVGMMRALLEAGVTPDLVVGCSVGALNAAYFAAAPTLEGVSGLETVWRSLRRADVFPMSWGRLIGFLRHRDHLVAADGLRRLVEQHLPFVRLEDARLPLHIVATDVLTGGAVVLSRGLAADAVLASSAIPGAFAPVAVDGRLLCDGAVASNTPVRIAVALGATRLIVLPTGFACMPEAPPRGALATALHAITLLTARQLISELEGLDDTISFHVVPPACPLGISPFDFSHTGALIERAWRQSTQWLAAGGLSSPVIPAGLYPHGHEPDGAVRPVVPPWVSPHGLARRSTAS